jgi:release factor H-coupled RctB family protein
MRALGVTRPNKIRGAFDVVHNSVSLESAGTDELWVHRKGCAPAHEGQPTAVLGSRGAPSWIMSGKGNALGLSSVAHGAGRKMKRSEAREKIRDRYRRKSLTKTAIGSTVICDDKKLLYEEHPDAYKPIEPIIDSLVRAELADRVAAIEPLLTVKK